MTKKTTFIALALLVALTGCRTTREAMFDEDQVSAELRAIQTKTYEDADKADVTRAVIQTLQDLNFEVTDVNSRIGTVRSTKYIGVRSVNAMVTVREKKGDVTVRVNANYSNNPVVEPVHYQKFFSALSKSVFLEENL